MSIAQTTTQLNGHEEELKMFKLAVEEASDHIVITDPEGIVLFANKGVERITGFSNSEVVGKKAGTLERWGGLMSQDFYEKFWKQIKIDKKVFKGEIKNRRKNGEEYIANLNVSPILDENGELKYFVGIERDVTVAKRAEKLLKESDSQYRSLFENILNGFAYCEMIYDSEGKPIDFIYRRVNEAFARLTGLENVTGKKVTELIPGIRESSPDLFEIYGRVAQTGKAEKFETEIPALKRWFSVSVYSPGEKYFIAVFDNITERKTIEETLRFEKAKDDAILSSIGEGVVVVDKDFKIMFLNKSAEVLMRFDPKETIDKKFNDLWNVVDSQGNFVPVEKRPITIAIKTGKTITTRTDTPYFYTRKDGTKFPVAITISPVILNGEVIGAVDVFRDVTHEKAVDRAKTEFISLASHQLRTPLTAIKWAAEMLLANEGAKTDTSQRENIATIRDANERMINLVNNLLNISRLEMGRLTIEPEEVDITKLINENVKELDQQIKTKNQTISVNISPELTHVFTDPDLLENVYINLIGNAVKYTPENGAIKVQVEKKDGTFLSTISDTGYGIPKEEQTKVFSRFYRGTNVVRKDTDGNGLGLYLVKQIIDAMHGKIWFESEIDKGTTFYVELPISGLEKKEGEVRLS